MKKSSKSSKSSSKGKLANAFPNTANGSLDYMAKQKKFAAQDAAVIKRSKYKDCKYGG